MKRHPPTAQFAGCESCISIVLNMSACQSTLSPAISILPTSANLPFKKHFNRARLLLETGIYGLSCGCVVMSSVTPSCCVQGAT